MKALGIPQPGAWLVINGYHAEVPLPKSTRHRGTVLIYALPNPISPETYQQFLEGCRKLRVTSHPRANDFELGGFLGTASLIECITSEEGAVCAKLESAEELGFVASSGRVGIFSYSGDPFEAFGAGAHPTYTYSDTIKTDYTPDSPRVNYSNHTPQTRTNSVYDEPDEPSFLDHFMDGVEQQARSEFKKNVTKLGRGLTKDALSIGGELLAGWLGGGKPRGRR